MHLGIAESFDTQQIEQLTILNFWVAAGVISGTVPYKRYLFCVVHAPVIQVQYWPQVEPQSSQPDLNFTMIDFKVKVLCFFARQLCGYCSTT